jgi:hypothetical protein
MWKIRFQTFSGYSKAEIQGLDTRRLHHEWSFYHDYHNYHRRELWSIRRSACCLTLKNKLVLPSFFRSSFVYSSFCFITLYLYVYI